MITNIIAQRGDEEGKIPSKVHNSPQEFRGYCLTAKKSMCTLHRSKKMLQKADEIWAANSDRIKKFIDTFGGGYFLEICQGPSGASIAPLELNDPPKGVRHRTQGKYFAGWGIARDELWLVVSLEEGGRRIALSDVILIFGLDQY